MSRIRTPIRRRLAALSSATCLVLLTSCATPGNQKLALDIELKPGTQSEILVVQYDCRRVDLQQVAKQLFGSETYPVQAQLGAPTDDSPALIVIDRARSTVTGWRITENVRGVESQRPDLYQVGSSTQKPLRYYIWGDNLPNADMKINILY